MRREAGVNDQPDLNSRTVLSFAQLEKESNKMKDFYGIPHTATFSANDQK